MCCVLYVSVMIGQFCNNFLPDENKKMEIKFINILNQNLIDFFCQQVEHNRQNIETNSMSLFWFIQMQMWQSSFRFIYLSIVCRLGSNRTNMPIFIHWKAHRLRWFWYYTNGLLLPDIVTVQITILCTFPLNLDKICYSYRTESFRVFFLVQG